MWIKDLNQEKHAGDDGDPGEKRGPKGIKSKRTNAHAMTIRLYNDSCLSNGTYSFMRWDK